ncbi:hypothetical protein [Anabaena sp. UHCC 0399]|uniref:hypothetical protein n=1 Tax=Anabaena sp. UHCC 0399 TaxID=3110238 RepID=UPI002B20563E|nr:hypothetical protein [Anabaena sp. UHCC 0399]MEA5569205.1 hypothetical protein [Anabaena sp. UHCC 0399]
MNNINHDSANTISPEIQAEFSTFIEPFFFKYHRERCYTGLVFRHGKRTMLQIYLPAIFLDFFKPNHLQGMILILEKIVQR